MLPSADIIRPPVDGYLTAEISAAALRSNLAQLRSQLAPGVRLCPVIKADAYGHGLGVVLPVLAPLVDGLAVATPSEAVRVRDLRFDRTLLTFFSVLGFMDPGERREALAELLASEAILTVTSREEADLIAEEARRHGRRAVVHVKIDTGMARSGVWHEEAGALLARLRRAPDLRLAGAYTHFATAEEDRGFAREQLARFRAALAAGGGHEDLTLHAANSAAIFELPESHLDLVRPGLAVYGIRPSPAVGDGSLVPALALKGRLMQVKTVPAGTGCSYGLTYTFTRPSRVGLVPVGYADGYPFALSDRATVRLRGRDVPVRGRVTMDQIVVDLTEVPEAAAGDEVEILSARPADRHSVESLARLAATIPHEIVTRLGTRVRRVLVE
jgi:alanine racemase